MRIKINYHINENYIMKKNREVLLAKSKIYHQNRIPYKQQIKDLKNKIEELTQTVEMLNLKIE